MKLVSFLDFIQMEVLGEETGSTEENHKVHRRTNKVI